MGFRDNLVKNKKGSYTLKSKVIEKSKTYCLECEEDGVSRDLLYEYNATDVLSVRNYMEEHLTTYSTHKTIKPDWCKGCNALKGYKVTLNDK